LEQELSKMRSDGADQHEKSINYLLTSAEGFINCAKILAEMREEKGSETAGDLPPAGKGVES
jgi:hypothetical protein